MLLHVCKKKVLNACNRIDKIFLGLIRVDQIQHGVKLGGHFLVR